ncbi:MAG: DUF5596 domain-containing protein [Clostridia bacterium]|nr:DUF5596 domain-containing protein [Clostridia bacterium]
MKIECLMERLGVKRYPARWSEFFDEVVTDVKENGCPLAESSYYQKLHDDYGVLDNLLHTYMQAADEIKADPDCLLFFALLRRAMRDRDKIRSDLAALDMPKGEVYCLKYAAIPSLIMCESIPTFYADMKARNVPDDIFEDSIKNAERITENYMKKHNGEVGFSNFDWHQLLYDGRLFRVKRLQLEFPFHFWGVYKVFESNNGEIVALAHNIAVHKDGMPLGSLHFEDDTDSFTAVIEENDTAYVGHPFDEYGKIIREKVTLSKSEWKVKLKGGDPVVSLHIPRGEKFDDATVQDTIDYSREFLDKCYPDYGSKAFFCASWLLDKQVEDILGTESNIARFGNRYLRMQYKNPGTAAINFVFNVGGKKFTPDTIEEAPENTRLEKALKKHYLEGKAIYEPHGVFF